MTANEQQANPENTEQLRSLFLGWQCRLRKYAIIRGGGRPTPGMQPELVVEDDGEKLGNATLHMIKKRPDQSTREFRHIYKRTQDPVARIDAALKLLATQYYRQPLEFSDQLTGLFISGSHVVQRLCQAKCCALRFYQNSQGFDLKCEVLDLPVSSAAHQATYWHNSLFNPSIPGDIVVLGFTPDWSQSTPTQSLMLQR